MDFQENRGINPFYVLLSSYSAASHGVFSVNHFSLFQICFVEGEKALIRHVLIVD